MRILVTPTFDRAEKNLHRPQKAELDEAVKTVAGDAQIDEEKVGDLAGIRVYKFRMSNQLWLLSYRIEH
jgi:mRNA interferase RelE/StbE